MQNRKNIGWLAASASVMLLGTMSFAQSSNTSSASTGNGKPQTAATMGANNNTARTGGVPSKDHAFIVKAAQGGMAEVELGQLAQQNGSSQQVKDFGKKMVDDHSKANDQLKQLASQKGVTLPTDIDAKDKATKDKLSKLQGDAFDKAYMRDMVTDHKKDVAEFQKEAHAGADPDVKGWAGQTVPTLEDHLKMAEQINGSTKTASKKGNGNAMSTGASASSSNPQ